MKFMDRVIFGCVLACGVGLATTANACSTSQWTEATGSITPDSPPAFPRFSELCAMSVTGTGSVRDATPDHDRIRVRFYAFSQLGGSGTAVLFRAYSDDSGTTTLFEVKRVNGDLVFDTTAAGGGASTPIAFPSGWVAIEFDWTSGGNMDASVSWVDVSNITAPTWQTATPSVGAGSGTVASVRLGLPAGLGGFTGSVLFDSYEAHSSTAVGLLPDGDANNDTTTNVLDYGAVQQEILGTLQPGQPDCNRDGSINIFDYGCIQAVILGG